MPTNRRYRKHARRQISGDMIVQLATGQDFFGTGFGDAVEGMREAWCEPEVRAAVYARTEARWPGAKPWAELAFGVDGDQPMVGSDVPFILDVYRQNRNAAIERRRASRPARSADDRTQPPAATAMVVGVGRG